MKKLALIITVAIISTSFILIFKVFLYDSGIYKLTGKYMGMPFETEITLVK